MIVSAEEIVAAERIAARPDATVLPHFLVDAVVEAPIGAFPHECYGRYEADFEHFDAYAGAVRRDGVRRPSPPTWTSHVHGPADFAGSWPFGRRAARALQAAARELVPRSMTGAA